MMPFEERLNLIINHLGLTPARFAELHGLGRVSIHRILKGETKPGLDTIERICLANPKISTDFLIRGEGSPLVDTREDSKEKNDTVKAIFEIQTYINTFLVNKVKDLTEPERVARERFIADRQLAKDLGIPHQ